ncbi:LPD38 domain-containing protein [Anaerosinus massiliensis]|uniref:LPD38 domain-containing protein n=1 Tax=Massilibacillus massiliensis TaxID=1806837 RepID=UPI000A807704|nr:LPD38 domain-containing protein [Massilibacillus massiliensis]
MINEDPNEILNVATGRKIIDDDPDDILNQARAISYDDPRIPETSLWEDVKNGVGKFFTPSQGDPSQALQNLPGADPFYAHDQNNLPYVDRNVNYDPNSVANINKFVLNTAEQLSQYKDKVVDDFSKLQSGNEELQNKVGDVAVPGLDPYYARDQVGQQYSNDSVSNPERITDEYNTLYDTVGNPAGKIAVTPFVPAPVRGVAGALFLPFMAKDMTESLADNMNPVDGSEPSLASATKKTLYDTLVDPVVDPVKRLYEDPKQFAQNIVDDPSRIFTDVFLPGAVGHSVAKGGKALYDKKYGENVDISDSLPEAEPLKASEPKYSNEFIDSLPDASMNEKILDNVSEGSLDINGREGGSVATLIAERTGLPSDWIWAQMNHETGGFGSALAREDHNYAGIKATNPRPGIDPKAPDGGYYRHFDSDAEYANYAARNLEAYREDGLFDAKNIDEFAAALKRGGYFTDNLNVYVNGLKNALEGKASVGGSRQRAPRIEDTSFDSVDIPRNPVEDMSYDLPQDKTNISALGESDIFGRYKDEVTGIENSKKLIPENESLVSEDTGIKKAPTADVTEGLSVDEIKQQLVSGVEDGLVQQRINDFVDKAISSKDYSWMNIREVEPREIKRIKELTGIDVTGYKHNITSDNIRHALMEHGDPAIEHKNWGQVAITDHDIKRIPEIVKQYDEIFPGEERGGVKSVIYKKGFADGTNEYLEVILTGRKVLRIKSMWKKPPARSVPESGNVPTFDSNGLPQKTDSALLPVRSQTSSTDINNIPQNQKLFNGKEYSLSPSGKPGGFSILENMRDGLLDKAYEAVNNGDYQKAYELAKQAGAEDWASAYKSLADTNGGQVPIAPRLEGKPKGNYEGDTVTKKQIIKRAGELFVPVRSGRIGAKDVQGFADHNTGVVRTRDYGDLNTMAHEIGHITDAALGLRSNAGLYDREFVRIVNKRFGEGTYAPEQVRAEGIAEFMKDYLTNETIAKAEFPQYYQKFKEAIAKNPDVYARVNEIKSMINVWNKQSAEARGRSGISYADEMKPTIKERIEKGKIKFVEDWIDDKVGLKTVTESYERATGEKLVTKDDPYKMARLAQNSSVARAQMLVESDRPELVKKSLNNIYGNIINEAVTIKGTLSALDNAMKGKSKDYLKAGNFKNWHEALDSLLVARRQIELHKVNVLDVTLKAQEAVEQAKRKLVEARKERLKVETSQNHPNIFEKNSAVTKFKELEEQAKRELNSTLSELEQAKNKQYKTPIDMKDAEKIINNAPKELHEAAQKIYKYNDNILRILMHSGMVKKVVYDALVKKYKNYVPMARDFADEAGIEKGFGMGSSFGNVRSALKSISEAGSTRQVVSPLESMVKNTYALLNLVERNRVGQTFTRLAESDRVGRLIEEVNGTAATKDSTFSVWVDGEKKVYQTTPEVYRAIMSVNKDSANIITKLLGPPASLLRAGATLMPDFAIKNIMRDTFGAAVFSRYGFRPVVDHAIGLFHMAKQDQLFHEYKASGALMSTMVGLDRNYIQGSLKGLYKKDMAHYWHHYNPVQMLRGFSEALETATRLGEYSRAKSKGVSIEDAALSARDISLDFSKHGVYGKTVNKAVAFFNAGVQEPARIIQAFKEDPAGTSARIGLYITLPSVVLWTMNHDQEWYKELPDYQKNLFWIFKAGDTVCRIPKPFGLGVVFGSLPERTLDWMIDKRPDAMKKWAVAAKDAFVPNFMPTAAAPLLEWVTNYSFFSGRDIVPQKEQKLPDAMQFGPNTSELAKIIGKHFDLSPRKIDNLISGYGAGMANQTLNAADALMGKREYQNPFSKAFVVDPLKSPQSIQDFYEKLNESEKVYNGAKIAKERPSSDDLRNYNRLKAANKIMQNLNKWERKAVQDGDKEKVNELNRRQLRLAQDALSKVR